MPCQRGAFFRVAKKQVHLAIRVHYVYTLGPGLCFGEVAARQSSIVRFSPGLMAGFGYMLLFVILVFVTFVVFLLCWFR